MSVYVIVVEDVDDEFYSGSVDEIRLDLELAIGHGAVPVDVLEITKREGGKEGSSPAGSPASALPRA